jgi:hypothetical protein
VGDEINNEEKCEQDARIALLEHYSSKSTNQTIILLTEVFGFFTLVGLLSTIPYRYYLMIIALGFFVCLVSHAFGRLVYWGSLARGIMWVEIPKMDDVQRDLEEEKAKLELQKPIEIQNWKYSLNLKATYLERLSLACSIYFGARRQRSLWFKVCNFLQSRKWKLLVSLLTMVLLIVRYYHRQL